MFDGEQSITISAPDGSRCMCVQSHGPCATAIRAQLTLSYEPQDMAGETHHHHGSEPRVTLAVHDLGLAAGNLLVEAVARGLWVHQTLGILPDKARQIFAIPAGFEAWTGLAIGYRGDPATLPDALQERDRMPRYWKPLRQFVFSGKWGNPSPLVLKR
jgi:hypothetical protein